VKIVTKLPVPKPGQQKTKEEEWNDSSTNASQISTPFSDTHIMKKEKKNKKNTKHEEEESGRRRRRKKKNTKHEEEEGEEEAEQEECSLFEPLSSYLHGGFLSSTTNLNLIGCLSMLLLFYVFVGFDGRKP
jgi:hypothetical protein